MADDSSLQDEPKPTMEALVEFLRERQQALAGQCNNPLEFPPQGWPVRLAIEDLRAMGCVGFPRPPQEPACIEAVRQWIDDVLAWAVPAEPAAADPPNDPPLLERMADVLSRPQLAIATRLLRSSADYDALKLTPGCFRDGVTDEAITRALERLRGRLNQNPEWGATLAVSASKRRASLQVLSDKTTDK